MFIIHFNPMFPIASSVLFFYTGFMGTEPNKRGSDSKVFQQSPSFSLCPADLIGEGQLQDRTPVTLRPVCPTDKAALCAMFSACSPKSLYSRFERQIRERPLDLAMQLCSIDGEREIAIVAEVGQGKKRKIIGVGQLHADSNHTMAEYAVLVADPWQGKGLGSALTDFCLKVATHWGIKKVMGEFSPSNVRIIRILQSRQFKLHRNRQEHIVSGEKILP